MIPEVILKFQSISDSDGAIYTWNNWDNFGILQMWLTSGIIAERTYKAEESFQTMFQ